jgi:hypothetical protein
MIRTMTRPMVRWTTGIFLALLVTSCSQAPEYRAEVTLEIDGKSYDYTTARAQVDQQETGGRYSVYLRPAAEGSKAPYLCLRTYSGNPVAELWVRYTKPERAKQNPDGDLDKYDCFVPGTLSDGRKTLGWTREDGKERDRTETGEAACQATVRQEGSSLYLDFDAVPQRKAPSKKKGSGDDKTEGPKDTIKVKGKAVVAL